MTYTGIVINQTVLVLQNLLHTIVLARHITSIVIHLTAAIVKVDVMVLQVLEKSISKILTCMTRDTNEREETLDRLVICHVEVAEDDSELVRMGNVWCGVH